MSWNSKQKRKALRGNKTAQRRFISLDSQELNTAKTLSYLGFKSSSARALYQREKVAKLNAKPLHEKNALDSVNLDLKKPNKKRSSHREVFIYPTGKKANYKVNKKTLSVVPTAKEFIKVIDEIDIKILSEKSL